MTTTSPWWLPGGRVPAPLPACPFLSMAAHGRPARCVLSCPALPLPQAPLPVLRSASPAPPAAPAPVWSWHYLAPFLSLQTDRQTAGACAPQDARRLLLPVRLSRSVCVSPVPLCPLHLPPPSQTDTRQARPPRCEPCRLLLPPLHLSHSLLPLPFRWARYTSRQKDKRQAPAPCGMPAAFSRSFAPLLLPCPSRPASVTAPWPGPSRQKDKRQAPAPRWVPCRLLLPAPVAAPPRKGGLDLAQICPLRALRFALRPLKQGDQYHTLAIRETP